MEPNLTTNDTKYEVLQEGRPCFISEFPRSVQSQFSYYSSLVLTFATTMLGLWCFLSNGLVLVTILRGGLRFRPGFLYLCSLTLTDFLWGGVVTPLYIKFRITELIAGEACFNRSDWDSPVMVVSFFLCLFAMVGTLRVMSVDRYLAVIKPWWYKAAMKMQYAITASFAVWVTSTFLVVLRQVKLFPRRAVETFEGGYIICFSAIVIAIQLCTLAALRKHNNACVVLQRKFSHKGGNQKTR